MYRQTLLASISCVLAAVGCHKSDAPVKVKDDAAVPVTAPIATPAHEKAIAAYRKKDWAAVRTQTETALGKDPMHLGSHRLLAAALAQTSEPAAAVDHLVTALAADYFQYAPTLADDDLKSF